MSDSYQAIYDATRSRISNVDIGFAVESAIRDSGISHYFMMAGSALEESAQIHSAPSAVFRPKLFIDGDLWCALYGDNLQDGVCGFGDSPENAMSAFDEAWREPLKLKDRP